MLGHGVKKNNERPSSTKNRYLQTHRGVYVEKSQKATLNIYQTRNVIYCYSIYFQITMKQKQRGVNCDVRWLLAYQKMEWNCWVGLKQKRACLKMLIIRPLCVLMDCYKIVDCFSAV